MPGDLSRRYRSIPHDSRRPHKQELTLPREVIGSEASSEGSLAPLADRPYGPSLPRTESSPAKPPGSSGASFSSSINQKTPARSFYHRSFHGSLGSRDAVQYSSQGVREETAELASLALSDAASVRSGTSPQRPYASAHPFTSATGVDSYFAGASKQDELGTRDSDGSIHPDVIEEVSEPVSPETMPSSHQSPRTSVLTQLILNSSSYGTERSSAKGTGDDDDESSPVATAKDRTTSKADERSMLLGKSTSYMSETARGYGATHDIEGQTPGGQGVDRKLARVLEWPKNKVLGFVRNAPSPKTWNLRAAWKYGFLKPASYVPPVVLGLLLNLLDALSYGMILFPLGQPIFAGLGPDGISMFYVSCIVSQLVYSCGGSIFKGGVGSEMIEVVPFFHKMAFTILARVGEDNPKSVLATTILSYSISSVITGAVFFIMGACKLGSLIGFFPRHILIGCIGGVGWFLIATGLEVSARLDGNLEYNLVTLQKLTRLDTIFLWLIPLVLAIVLLVSQRWVKSSVFVPLYFLVIPAIFYFFVAAIPDLNLDQLRNLGWVFEAPEAGKPWYDFYTLYDFKAVNWEALLETVPAMFALTFFGVLHVPINVPALGLSTGEDNLNVDRELIAHGVSNALSGFAGSIQNYLVYTNSLLFMRSGGDSRVAGIILAIGTFAIMVIGPVIIGYIPVLVVGALIFLLGIDLMREALVDTWGKLSRLEYLTIVVIVVTMGAWDFVVGILIGIILACVNFVVQTSRKSAIRATYSGEVAGSTVRRHPSQRHYLREVGKQTQVMKLAGYLFFGTIVSVESKIRALLEEEEFGKRPIRFLIFDLFHVNGIDFSAAEAFTRINRIIRARNVDMVISGLALDTEVGSSLRNVGLFDENNEVQVFQDLNSALEHCENELLKAFYHRREALAKRNTQADFLDVPQADLPLFPPDGMFGSPRRQQLHRVAATTLKEHDVHSSSKWKNFKQPLPLILQTFQDLTVKNEDFWYRACPFFERKEYAAGAMLYKRGDRPNGFYLLEDGIFRAEYDLPQGKYYESIVAGTTCGELPFFSATNRTATVAAEKDCVAWLLGDEKWEELQKGQPDVAQELLRISLKLTSERMSAITSYVLTTAG